MPNSSSLLEESSSRLRWTRAAALPSDREISSSGDDFSPRVSRTTKAQQKAWWHLQLSSRVDFFLKQNALFQKLGGAVAGAGTSLTSLVSGVNTWIHEYCGHCLLGAHLTHSYQDGEGPRYVVFAWEAMQEGGVSGWIDWLLHNDGKTGYASVGRGAPNALGTYLGPELRSAWGSVSGSVPLFFISASSVIGGMAVREKVPALGGGLVGLGMIEHAASSAYPWRAAVMASEQLLVKARTGHDFANFAVQMAKVTSFSPKAIAIATACSWTLSIPLLALGIYLLQKSRDKNLVSNRILLQHWLAQSIQESAAGDRSKEELFAQLCENYTKRDVPLHRDVAFFEYLLKNIPNEELQQVQKELTPLWAQPKPKSTIEIAMNAVAIGSTVVSAVMSVASEVFKVLEATVVPSLAPAASICGHLSPFLRSVILLSEGYEVYKDMKTPLEEMPKLAKVLSVSKLVVAVVGSTFLIVGAFIPGINVFVFLGIVLGTGGTIAFAIAKQLVIRRQAKLYQSIDPLRCNIMINLSKNPEKRELLAGVIERWVKDVRSAANSGLLKKGDFLRDRLREVSGLEDLDPAEPEI